jgi:hypothetical protein
MYRSQHVRTAELISHVHYPYFLSRLFKTPMNLKPLRSLNPKPQLILAGGTLLVGRQDTLSCLWIYLLKKTLKLG